MRRLLVPLFIALGQAFYARPATAQAPVTALLESTPTSATEHARPVSQPEAAHITLYSNRHDVALERRVGSVDLLQESGEFSGTTSVWARVCMAPCRAWVDPSGQFRIAGEGVAPSSSFTLDPRRRAVRIDANAGSQRALSLGKTFVSTGIGLMALGTVLLIVPSSGDDPSSTSAFKTLRTFGYGALGAGGALTLTGIPLWVANGTTITMSSGPALSGRAPTGVILGARRTLF